MIRLLTLGVALLPAGATLAKTTGPNYYTPEQIERARERYRTDERAQRHVQTLKDRTAYVMEMSDDELWRFIPPAQLPRATFLWRGQGNFPGCPECGSEIFRVGGGFYPWTMSRDKPWQVKCPNCESVFPTNDFASHYENDFEGECDMSGEYPDDGSGWVSPGGLRHYFVGHWGQWQRWDDVLRAIPDLAEIYLVTGEEPYARTVTVLLCRLAEVYPDTKYDAQSNYGALGRILPWCWENMQVVTPISIAYDSVWPYMRAMGDETLRTFLAGKGVEDWCAHVDQGFLQDIARNMIHTDQYLSNEGDHQAGFAVVALVWGDNDPARGITTNEMLEWLATGRGNMEYLVWNDIYADGFPNEASPGYSSAVSVKAWRIARDMARAGYDLFASPRMEATAHVWLDITMCGLQQPAIGDYGSILGGGRAGWDPQMLRWAWERYGDPRFAKAITARGNPAPGLFEPDLREEIAAAAAQHPGPVVSGTRNISQFGCAILESHVTDRPRALSLYYGSAAGGHGHHDRLNIELYAHGRSMMPDLGYPDQWGSKTQQFHNNSTSHYVVQIDETGHQTMARGNLHFLADLDEVQVVEASGESAYPNLADLYRRTTALVDVSDTDFYLVDIFRVRGGSRHDWLFHGPPQEGFEAERLALSEPREGTLAGPDVEVGAAFEGDRRSGYQWLHSVQQAVPEADWTVTYPPADGRAGLRMTMLPGCAREVFVAQVDSPRIRAALPATLPWVVARNETEGMSTFAAVIRTPHDADCIEAVEAIPLPAGSPEGAVALQVTTAEFVDTIYSTLDPTARAVVGEQFTAAARFVLVRRDREGGLVSVHAVGAESLEAADFSLASRGELEGVVTAIDPEANTLTVQGFPPLDSLAGQSVLFSNALRQTNFQVETVAPDNGNALLGTGYVSLITGRGEVREVEEATHTVITDTLWRTHGTLEIWAKGFHPALEGMSLANADGSWRALIEACQLFPDLPKEWWQPEADHGFIRVAAAGPLSEVFAPGDPYFVHAVAPGDRAALPTSLVMQVQGEGLYGIKTTTDLLTVTVPGAGEEAVYKSTGPRPDAAPLTPQRGAFSLDAGALSGGRGILILNPDPAVDYADTAPPQLVRLTLDGRETPYEPGMDLSASGVRQLGLEFTDANPMLPPQVVRAGRPLDPGAAGMQVQEPTPGRMLVTLDVAALAAAITAAEVDYPPTLTVSVRDRALNPEACTVRFVLPGLAEPSADAVFLSDLEAVTSAAHGGLKRDQNYYGESGFNLRGRHFEKGIMICPRADGPSEAVYDLSAHPDLRVFRAVIGVEDTTGSLGSVTFDVHVDDGAGGWTRLYAGETLRGGAAVRAITVDLGAASMLRLVCTDAGDGHNSDHATWANARLESAQ